MAKALSREEMLDRIRDAGVVGAGGGGFPTHLKYRGDAEIDTVICNAAECEPLIRVDQQEMALRPAELLRGIELAVALSGAKRGIIGLKAKYKPAIAALNEQMRLDKGKHGNIEIFEVGNYYPAGDELVMVKEITGRVIPEFGLPLHVGVIVNNVVSLMNLARAVDHGQPVVERMVTVQGEVRRPASFRVPIGTPYSALVEAAGGVTCHDDYWVVGGPMMGEILEDKDAPVTRTSSLVLVLPRRHPVVQRRLRSLHKHLHDTRAACLKCNLCTQVCPRNALGHRLDPDRTMRNVASGVAHDLEAYKGAFLCTECGLCSVYGCVQNLDPAYMNRELKRLMSQAGLERPTPPDSDVRPASVNWAHRKVPVIRLIARLGLMPYDKKAALVPFELDVPELRIALSQHAGAPAVPVVKAGERVREGQLVGAAPEGKLGAPVHASTDGEVIAVDDLYITIRKG